MVLGRPGKELLADIEAVLLGAGPEEAQTVSQSTVMVIMVIIVIIVV